MSRYIDADALIEKKWQVEDEGCFYALVDVVSVTDIEEAPSIDIVRCKECKWGKPYSGKQFECDAIGLGGLKFPDDYCSYGEREGD